MASRGRKAVVETSRATVGYIYIPSFIIIFLDRLGSVSSFAPVGGSGAVIVLVAVVFAMLDASDLGAKVS